MTKVFDRFANAASEGAGTPWAFMTALTLLFLWALSGPVFKFSDTWQLIINTSTTIITFLMVFLIQHTQNKDTRALQAKIDGIIHVTQADNRLLSIEDLSDKDLKELQDRFKEIGRQEDTDTEH